MTLRSLPNGVRDELNLKTGEYIKRIGEIVEKRYGFQLKITISGKEYEKNKKNIRRYVVDKIKQTDDYKKCLMECIRKEDADREYTIDTYIADECNNPNLHYSINKIEEYIPQY